MEPTTIPQTVEDVVRDFRKCVEVKSFGRRYYKVITIENVTIKHLWIHTYIINATFKTDRFAHIV